MRISIKQLETEANSLTDAYDIMNTLKDCLRTKPETIFGLIVHQNF